MLILHEPSRKRKTKKGRGEDRRGCPGTYRERGKGARMLERVPMFGKSIDGPPQTMEGDSYFANLCKTLLAGPHGVSLVYAGHATLW